MDDKKKYYWLKFTSDFFQRNDIKIIEAMPNGTDYVLTYIKMLLESVEKEGILNFNEKVAYSDQMLSVVLGVNIDIVRGAKAVFSQLGLIDVFDDGTIYMSEIENLLGFETAGAKRKRIERERQRAQMTLFEPDESGQNGGQISDNVLNCPDNDLNSPENVHFDSDNKKEKKKDKKEEKDITEDIYTDIDTHTIDARAREDPSESHSGKYSTDFVKFWVSYPRQQGIDAAWAEWQRRKPSKETLAEILCAISAQMQSQEWTAENGRYIPNPARYLREGRWKDTPIKSTGQSFDDDEFFRAALARGYKQTATAEA